MENQNCNKFIPKITRIKKITNKKVQLKRTDKNRDILKINYRDYAASVGQHFLSLFECSLGFKKNVHWALRMTKNQQDE